MFLIVLATMLLASTSVSAQVPTTQEWGCSGEDPRYKLPIQVKGINGGFFEAASLDVATGEYNTLLTMGAKKDSRGTNCNGEVGKTENFDINSCGKI